MRGLIWCGGLVAVMSLAVWGYVENYRTRDALSERRALVREIAQMRAETARLEAEWALLNRPERLRALAELSHADLGLAPMTPEAFGTLSDLPPLEAPAPYALAAGTP